MLGSEHGVGFLIIVVIIDAFVKSIVLFYLADNSKIRHRLHHTDLDTHMSV